MEYICSFFHYVFVFSIIFQNNILLVTCKRFFSRVTSQMYFKCASAIKIFITMNAFKCIFASVHHSIYCITRKTLYAYLKHLSCVIKLAVNMNFLQFRKLLFTLGALIWSLASMNTYMIAKTTFLPPKK